MYEQLPVTPSGITWARERSGFSLDAAQKQKGLKNRGMGSRKAIPNISAA